MPAFFTYRTMSYTVQGIRRMFCNYDKPGVPKWLRFSFRLWLFNVNMTVPVVIVFIVNGLIVMGVFRASQNKLLDKDDSDVLQKKLAKNLFIISLVFFCTNAPYTIFSWIESLTTRVETNSELAVSMSNFIVFNYAINFVIYSFTLQYFRDDLKALCYCWRITPNKG